MKDYEQRRRDHERAQRWFTIVAVAIAIVLGVLVGLDVIPSWVLLGE